MWVRERGAKGKERKGKQKMAKESETRVEKGKKKVTGKKEIIRKKCTDENKKQNKIK